MAPVVVWACDGDLVLIDAFRRLSASRSINGCDTLLMRVLGCDTGSATADLHNLNPVGRGAKEIKEAWIEQALIREDGLIQVDVSELLGHHRSWVSQRPALLERLCNAA